MLVYYIFFFFFFFSSRRRHTRSLCDWSSDVCSSDLSGWFRWTTTFSAVTTENVSTLRKRSPFPRPCQQSLGEVEALRQLADLGLERQQSILDVRHAALGGRQPRRGVARFPAAQAAAVTVFEVARRDHDDVVQ